MSSLLRRSDRRTNLKLFILAGIVSSELMWIIRTDNKRADLERKYTAQIKITRSVVDRLKSGEKVDVEKELLNNATPAVAAGDESQSVASILQNLEAMDSQWSQAGGSNVLKAPRQDSQPPSTGKGSGFL